ncbi:MAG: hypothetical protein KGZ97_03580 [Bacteroidetes bacterium]|nr:hypothetical protein [Bacteroidota bacterium]
MNKSLGTISVLIKDRQANVNDLQNLLTEKGHFIRNRLGVNLEPTCLSHCLGFMVLVVEGNKQELEKLNQEISDLSGINSKLIIVTE